MRPWWWLWETSTFEDIYNAPNARWDQEAVDYSQWEQQFADQYWNGINGRE